MKSVLRKLLWTVFALLTTLVLAVLALGGWLFAGDLNVLKPHIEKYASEASGYDFRIEGDFSLDIAEHSVLVAEGLKLRHLDTETDATVEIASIGRLEVRVSLRSLFSGPIRVELLDLDNTRIHLSAGILESNSKPEVAVKDEAAAKGRVLVLEQALIDDFVFVYDDPDRDRPLHLNILTLRHNRGDKDFLELDVKGIFNGENLRLKGEMGSWDAVLAGRDIQYDMELELDTLDVQSSGVIDDILNLRRPTLEFSAHSPSIDDLTVLLGLGDEGEGSIDLTGSLQAQDDGHLHLVVNGNVGRTEVFANGFFSDLQNLEEVDLNLQVTGPDLRRILALGGITLQQRAPFEVSLEAKRNGPQISISEMTMEFGAATLTGTASIPQFPSLENSQISLQAEGPDIVRLRDLTGLQGGATGPFSMSLETRTNAEGDTFLDASLNTSLARTTAKSEIGADFSQPLSEIEFTIAGRDLAAVVSAFAPTDFVPAKPFDLEGVVRFVKNGVDIESLNGEIGSSSIRVDGHVSLSRKLAGTRFEIAAEGPAIEELVSSLGAHDVRPGDYAISVDLELRADALAITDFKLRRSAGELDLDLELALPVSRRQAKVDFSAFGEDFRYLLRGISRYEAPEAKFAAKLAGDLDGAHVRIDELTFELGAATFSASGDINLSEDDANTHFTFRTDIPDLAAIGRWDGRALNSQALSWQGDVVGDATELRIDNLAVRLGDSDIAGSVLLTKGDVPDIVIDIRSDRLTYAPIVEAVDKVDYDSEPDFEDGKLIPDIAMPFEDLRKLNASLDIEIGELERDELAMSDIRLQAALRDGVIAIEHFGFRARAGALVAKGRLDPADGGSASLQIVARNFAMGMGENNRDLAMTGDVDIRLDATGADLRTLLGSANGVVFINARGGRTLNNRFLHAMYGSLLNEILGTINPFKQSEEYTDYECLVLPMQFENGVATTVPSAFVSTDKIRISLNPELNFGTEDILIDIRTIPRKTLGVSAGEFLNPYILVKGTMAAPRLAVDEQGVLISGGVAVATGGLSMLARATWNRLSGGSDPCGKVANKAQQELAPLFPDIPIADVMDE